MRLICLLRTSDFLPQIGWGKYRNILITDPDNCDTCIILNLVTIIHQAFANPAQNTFAWIGAEKAEIVYLNDLRWNEKVIPRNNFLQLFEGAEAHLAALKNHSPEDLKSKRDIPVFPTSIGKIRKYVTVVVYEGETEMMNCQWNLFKFHYQTDSTRIRELEPCQYCFAKLFVEH